MTINSTTRKAGPFIGNGTVSAFPFGFKVFQASDLFVVRLNVSAAVEQTLVLNSDYSVTLNPDQNSNPGGVVTLLTGALASGYTLTLTSDVPDTQPTDLTNQGGFYPEVINDALDRATIQIQQLQEEMDRTITAPISTPAGTDLTFPLPEANQFIGWNSTATGLQNLDGSTLASIIAFATAYADTFNGDGATSTFALSYPPATVRNLDVSINGVTQVPVVDYNINGQALNFTTPPPLGSVVLAKYWQALPNSSGAAQDFTLNPNGYTTAVDVQEGFDDLGSSAGTSKIGFLQTGTGAQARSAQAKLRDVVSVKDFGAVGDGVADDTAAIQAALDYCETSGAFLVGQPGTYLITSTLTIKCSGDLSAMEIEADATAFSPAIQVGPAAAAQYLFDADLKLPKVTNTAKVGPGWVGFDTAIGILCANVYQSRITVPYIYNFGIGLKTGGYSVGNVYNTYAIGVLFNNKVNLLCQPGDGSGWSNQNTYIGGRYGYSSTEGVTVSGVTQIKLRDFTPGGINAPNTNVWINPSIEGDEPEFHLDIQGSFNTFISPRLEVSSLLTANINFYAATAGETSGNYLYGGYAYGVAYTYAGAGTSVNNGWVGSRGGGALDFSGSGYNTRNTNGNTVASPHFQGFSAATQPLPKDQTSTDWTYRIFAEGFAVKNPSDTAPRVAMDASGYMNFGGGASVAGGFRYSAAATAITSNIDFAPDADGTLSLGKSNRQWNRIWATLPTYANNAAALAGGLTAGAFYKTATGELRVVV